MSSIKTIEGSYTLGSANYGIAVSRYNSFIVEQLLDGALEALRKHGVEDREISIVKVPGAFELPLAVKAMAESTNYDAIIFTISYDLHFKLFPTYNRFFYKNLSNRRLIKSTLNNFLKFLSVIGNTSSATTHRE